MDAAVIPVLVLAGGRGERLAGRVPGPKPLAPVAGRPFIVYPLAALWQQGFRRVIFLTGHQADLFRREVLAERGRSPFLNEMDLRFLAEREPLGTGGALAAAADLVPERALLLNGDSYCDLDLAGALDLLAACGAELCLAAVHVAEAGDYGRLVIAGRCVRGFAEKGGSGAGWINAGVYALTRRFIAAAVPPGPCSLERDVLPGWVARQATPVVTVRGLFRDIGTPARLEAAQAEFPPPELAWLSGP
jgi:NDP-sugar pyrophosphorylase family protein